MKKNNEWDRVKESRFHSLVEQIDFYSWVDQNKGILSKEQLEHLKELRNTISAFGKEADCWYELANEILGNYEKEL